MSRSPITAHDGTVDLRHDFKAARSFLLGKGAHPLETAAGTHFTAQSTVSRDGRDVIRFFQRGKEYARSYSCCWGNYYNCNRTRIGMYCAALDAAIGKR